MFTVSASQVLSAQSLIVMPCIVDCMWLCVILSNIENKMSTTTTPTEKRQRVEHFDSLFSSIYNWCILFYLFLFFSIISLLLEREPKQNGREKKTLSKTNRTSIPTWTKQFISIFVFLYFNWKFIALSLTYFILSSTFWNVIQVGGWGHNFLLFRN